MFDGVENSDESVKPTKNGLRKLTKVIICTVSTQELFQSNFFHFEILCRRKCGKISGLMHVCCKVEVIVNNFVDV